MRYVKRCPRCGAINDELDAVCGQCEEFLGLVAAEPEPNPASASAPAPPVFTPPSEITPAASAPEHPTLYLEHTGGIRWPVQPGQTVGQAWPDNGPDVAIEGLPGTRYLHRRHCRFHYENRSWSVEALAQEQFVNPTLINGNPAAPGTRMPLHDGDRLTLSGLDFTIRILTQ